MTNPLKDGFEQKDGIPEFSSCELRNETNTAACWLGPDQGEAKSFGINSW